MRGYYKLSNSKMLIIKNRINYSETLEINLYPTKA